MAVRKRRWLQVSLRTFLGLFLLAGVGLGWIGRHVNEYRAEQRVIAEIHASTPYSAVLQPPPLPGQIYLPAFG